MKIRSPLLLAGAGLAGATLIRHWMSTLDYRAAWYDQKVDPARADCDRQRIYVFWHEYILTPLYMRGHCNLSMLISQHGDADILDRLALHFGFSCVRGSSTRGGAAALRNMLHNHQRRHLAITPDGPRGPRRQLALGPVYLASKLGLPIVCLGVGYDRPWRLKSWDRFAIPRPFSRVRGVISPEMRIPPELDRDGLEHYRQEVQRMLNRLTAESEAWAELGGHKVQEQPAYKGPERRPAFRHGDPYQDPLRPYALPPAVPQSIAQGKRAA